MTTKQNQKKIKRKLNQQQRIFKGKVEKRGRGERAEK